MWSESLWAFRKSCTGNESRRECSSNAGRCAVLVFSEVDNATCDFEMGGAKRPTIGSS